MPSIYYGQNAEFDIIAFTRGRQALGFVESFEIDVSHTNKRLYFFNKKEAFAVSIFEGVSGRFGFLDTEEKLLMASLMNVTALPSGGIVNDDPGAYLEFRILLNLRNELGVVQNGIFVKGCRISGNPESIAPREEQHGQVSYIGSTRYKMKGGGVLYTRVVRTPTFTTTDDVTATGGLASPLTPWTATLTKSAVSVNINDPITTRSYLAIYKNGNDITADTAAMTGITVSGTTVSIPYASMGATDLYEFFTPYKPA